MRTLVTTLVCGGVLGGEISICDNDLNEFVGERSCFIVTFIPISPVGNADGVSRILAQVARIVDSIVIERVECCIATSISCLTRSKIEDFYGNVKWKLEESLRMTLQEAKMHGKETFSLAYNLI